MKKDGFWVYDWSYFNYFRFNKDLRSKFGSDKGLYILKFYVPYMDVNKGQTMDEYSSYVISSDREVNKDDLKLICEIDFIYMDDETLEDSLEGLFDDISNLVYPIWNGYYVVKSSSLVCHDVLLVSVEKDGVSSWVSDKLSLVKGMWKVMRK